MTDTSDPPTPTAIIERIAREAALSNIRLHVATRMFDGIYLANALHLANGNVARAAEIAGIERAHLYRMLRAKRDDNG